MDFTARERDCNGCHCERCAQLLRSPTNRRFFRRVSPTLCLEGSFSALNTRGIPPPRNLRVGKQLLCKEKGAANKFAAARLNFQQQQQRKGSGGRSQQVPGIMIHLSLTACQHLTACVRDQGFKREKERKNRHGTRGAVLEKKKKRGAKCF